MKGHIEKACNKSNVHAMKSNEAASFSANSAETNDFNSLYCFDLQSVSTREINVILKIEGKNATMQ